MKTNNDLFHSVLSNTSEFVSRRIENLENREHYLNGMKDVLLATTVHPTMQGLWSQLSREYGYQKDHAQFKKALFSDERAYRLLAYEQTIELISSIQKRFGDDKS